MHSTATGVRFTETMKGHITFGETDYHAGEDKGKQTGTTCSFTLTISFDDIEKFDSDPLQRGTAVGTVTCEALGGELEVEEGRFNLFVDVGVPHLDERNMRYRLFFTDKDGRALTLSGHKVVKDDGVLKIWHDTTTLSTRILEGHVDDDEGASILAAGIIHILPIDFAKQMTTFRTNGPTFGARAKGLARFGGRFAGTIKDVYGPKEKVRAVAAWRNHSTPMYTLDGVRDAEITSTPFWTDDGLGLTLTRFKRGPSRDVVLLSHGLTTSTDMFIMPEHRNIVSYLLDNGISDVWSMDWRGSNRFHYDLAPNGYSLDDVALFDLPAALAEMRRQLGPDVRIHLIAHCVGALAGLMSVFGGVANDLASVTANSVGLTPRVPRWSSIKLRVAPPAVAYLFRFPNLNPRWSYLPGPGIPQGKGLSKLVSLGHRECDNPACHMVSFMWGSGHPGAYMHENLPEETHDRLGDLFGAVNINYYRHVSKMVGRGVAVQMNRTDPRFDALPNNYFDKIYDLDLPPLFLITGDTNRVFADSNVAFNRVLDQLIPDHDHELHVFPGYGHQDVFMGKANDQDTFPVILDFIRRHG